VQSWQQKMAALKASGDAGRVEPVSFEDHYWIRWIRASGTQRCVYGSDFGFGSALSAQINVSHSAAQSFSHSAV